MDVGRFRPTRRGGIPLLVVIACLARPAQGQVPAIMYHAHPNLGYVRDNFTAHLDYLAANGFTTITLDQLYQWRVNDGILPYRPILLTVDDNYILGYTEMFPALRSRGMVATNYTHTRGIGIGQPKASWAQVAEMDAAGVFLVEAHSQSHPRLTDVSATQLRQEVAGSRQDIAVNVGGKVSDHFAYPYGGYNAAVIAELQAAGFKTGMTTIKGLNTRSTPLFELRRWHGDGRTLAQLLAETDLGKLPAAAPGAGWILDDADPAASPRGSGWASTASAASYEGASLVGTGGTGSTVRWAAQLPSPGTMQVYARWSSATTRTSSATYTIEAADGGHAVTVDQRTLGGTWVPLGQYSFAAGQPVVVTLGGGTGTLSADAVWFEPVATPSAPRALSVDVAFGRLTQRQAGWGWIGPEWSALRKTGTGGLVLDRANALTGPVTIDAGSLVVGVADALTTVPLISTAAAATLDLVSLTEGYRVPSGQTIAGLGSIAGSVTFGRGTTLSPGAVALPPTAVVPVPEPATTLLVSGMGATWLTLRRFGRRRLSGRGGGTHDPFPPATAPAGDDPAGRRRR